MSSKLVLLLILLVTCLSTTVSVAAFKKGDTYIVIMSDGKVHTGTLVSETRDSIVLKVAKKGYVTISRADIEEVLKSKVPPAAAVTESLPPSDAMARQKIRGSIRRQIRLFLNRCR